MNRLVILALGLPLIVLLAGCGGGSSSSGGPTIQPAKISRLVDFTPTAPAVAGKPTVVSFVIQQPNGKPLIHFKRGPGRTPACI